MSSWIASFKRLGVEHRARVIELASFVARNSGIPGGGAIAGALESIDRVNNQQQLQTIEEVLRVVLGQGEDLVAEMAVGRLAIKDLKQKQRGARREQRRLIARMEASLKRIPDLPALLDQRFDRLQADLAKNQQDLARVLGGGLERLAERIEQLHRRFELGDAVGFEDAVVTRTLKDRRSLEDVVEELKALPAAKASDPLVANELGRLRLLNDDADGAAREFERAAAAEKQRGEKGFWEEELEETEKRRAEFLFNAFHARLQSGRLDKALEHYREATLLDAARALFNHGLYQADRIAAVDETGVTFGCEEVYTGRRVLVKAVLQSSARHDAIFREARILRDLACEQVVQVLAADCAFRTPDSATAPFLVSEDIGPVTIRTLVDDEGPIELRRARPILLSLIQGLQTIHRRGRIHRDLRPANVGLVVKVGESDWQAKLLGFSLVCRAPRSARPSPEALLSLRSLSARSLDEVGDFTAPEVTEEEGVTPAVDVFSFGLTAITLLCGTTRPGPRERADLPAELWRALDRCTAEDPARRPALAELQEALQEAASAESPAPDGTIRVKPVAGAAVIAADLTETVRGSPGGGRTRSRTTGAVGVEPSQLQLGAWLALSPAQQDWIGGLIAAGLSRSSSTLWTFAPRECRLWPLDGRACRIIAFSEARSGVVFHLVPGGRRAVPSGRLTVEVAIAPLLVSRSPVTRRQWERVRGSSSGASTPRAWPGQPVTRVPWFEATSWSAEIGARLLSESEWEHACSAGVRPDNGGVWHRGNANGESHEVGLKPANGFGLQDMLGNVREWVADAWTDPREPHLDGSPATSSASAKSSALPAAARVVKGGGFLDPPERCSLDFRDPLLAERRNADVGFRVARSLHPG